MNSTIILQDEMAILRKAMPVRTQSGYWLDKFKDHSSALLVPEQIGIFCNELSKKPKEDCEEAWFTLDILRNGADMEPREDTLLV